VVGASRADIRWEDAMDAMPLADEDEDSLLYQRGQIAPDRDDAARKEFKRSAGSRFSGALYHE
jgi:hypothetical protein